MNMLAKKAKKGFTIVELVIVIAVIAILAAVLIPTFTSVINNANESSAMQESKNEWTEYLSNIAADGEYAQDDITYYIVYDEGEYVFEVSEGVFNTDPVATNAKNTLSTYTANHIKIEYTYTYSSDNLAIYAPVATTDGMAERAAVSTLATTLSAAGTYYVKVTVSETTKYFAVTVAASTASGSVSLKTVTKTIATPTEETTTTYVVTSVRSSTATEFTKAGEGKQITYSDSSNDTDTTEGESEGGSTENGDGETED